MISVMIVVFVASLVGSPHCACMCGPIIALTMGLEKKAVHRGREQIVLYHFGRLLAYISLGALAALVGTRLDQTGFLLGVQHCSAFLSALLLFILGFISISRVYGYPLRVPKAPEMLRKFIFALHRKALAFKPFKRAMVTGLLTSILPCGWLYIFVIMAGGTGSLISGAVIMLAFWIGTLPVLTVLTFGLQKFTIRLSPKFRLIPAVVIIFLGVFTVSTRMMADRNRQVPSFEISQLFKDNRTSVPNAVSQLQSGCKKHDQ